MLLGLPASQLRSFPSLQNAYALGVEGEGEEEEEGGFNWVEKVPVLGHTLPLSSGIPGTYVRLGLAMVCR